MESYIVRIYRKDRSARRGIVGVVEVPGRDDRRAFTDRDELWGILTRAVRPGRDAVRARPPRRRG